MLISKKWLQQYVDVADIDAQTLADTITDAGFEVEGMEQLGTGINLIIGHVLTCKDHPDSDHLHVCSVNIGSETTQIVCGAPNVAAGQNVIVALPGAKLPGGEIKQGVIRGEESNGMICSLAELNVDEKYISEEGKTGIEVLPADAVVGNTEVLSYLGLDDTIFDIGLTPNRNDCVAAWSMALEVGAILNKPVTIPYAKDYKDEGKPTSLTTGSQSEKCSVFLGKKIGKLTIQPSIPWMKELLLRAGIKPINNVVDISNYVMLETGQPLHFYDTKSLPAMDLHVEDDYEGNYEALDQETYAIEKGDLVIFSDKTPVGIAGIMGGEDSKIQDTTTSIVIEAAVFDHVSIRNTSRRLNLNTDASARYQKGIDLEGSKKAMNRAVELLIQYANASELEETAVFGNPNYDGISFDVSIASINSLLGVTFTKEEMMDVLCRLDFAPKESGDTITVSIPSYRKDIREECDIAEEVIRILGYDRLPQSLPLMPATVGERTLIQKLRNKTREYLCGLGYQEAITYSLVSDKRNADAIFPTDKKVELASPMSGDRKIVRSSILPSLLEVMAYNGSRSLKDLAFFEIGNCYEVGSYEERLSIVVNGSIHKNRWKKIDEVADFYTIKGVLETYFSMLGFASNRISYKVNDKDVEHFHPYRSATVYVGKECIGIFGQIHPTMAENYEVESTTIMLEMKLSAIASQKVSKVKYEPISKFQSITRDFAFVISKDQQVGTLQQAIMGCGKVGKENVIRNIEVFDVYDGEHVEDGYASIALQVTMQSDHQTLGEEQIKQVHEAIIEVLAKHGASLRG